MFLLYVLLNSCAVYVKAAAHRFFYKVTITVSGLGVAVPTTVLLKKLTLIAAAFTYTAAIQQHIK